jgi:hypothetical protein
MVVVFKQVAVHVGIRKECLEAVVDYGSPPPLPARCVSFVVVFALCSFSFILFFMSILCCLGSS